MEDESQPQKGIDQHENPETEAPAGPEAVQHELGQKQAPDNKKSFKRFLLINLIVVGSIILVGSIFVLIMVRSSPVKPLAEENAKLRAEIKQLQKASFGQEKRSEQVQRTEELIEVLQPRLGPMVIRPIADAVVKYSQMHDLPPELILSIIHHASGFEITAENEQRDRLV